MNVGRFIIAATLLLVSNLSMANSLLEQYTLGNGDEISIQVFDEVDLTMSAVVGDSGIINYSYLGIIQVAGKTPEELENEITVLLKDGYLVNPSVNVTVNTFRPFFINGEVNRPGSYPFQPGLTVEKAIALAGGMTDRASRRKLYLARLVDGNTNEKKVNMGAQVEPGDVVTIKEGFF